MIGQTTIFDLFKEQGYESHIIWSKNYNIAALPYANCFSDAKIHSLDINQPVGPHFKGMESIQRDEARTAETMEMLYREIDSIVSVKEPIFLWIHLPHVLLGRTSYGDDIDLMDDLVGYLRGKFTDDNIFITADHGNMNAVKGQFGYGFDVYESAIWIPLITPRINNQTKVEIPTSNVDLSKIILDRKIPEREFVISDSAYFAQPRRMTAIISGDMKLIYDKYHKKYMMYNVKMDPNENMNLLNSIYTDKERHVAYNAREVYFYPFWNKVDGDFNKLNAELKRIWKIGNFYEETICKYKHLLSNIKRALVLKKNKRKFRK